MLRYEDAQKQLEPLKVGRNVLTKRLEALTGKARDTALLSFRTAQKDELTGWGQHFFHYLNVADREALFAHFAALSENEQVELFEAFFPAFGDVALAAFKLHGRLPYQEGYSRKAFRISGAPRITATASLRWLERLLTITSKYDPELGLEWYAAWAPYLGYGADDALGILFAAAIEEGHAEVYDILVTSAKGEHPVGAMGRHVTRALLVAEKPEGWTFVEKLLIAAQRQEGLRQVILETIDEAHPEAFKRMLELLSREKLSRFAAVVRAVDVWFNFQLEAAQGKRVDAVLEKALLYLSDTEARDNLLAKPLSAEDAEDVYLALWAVAYQDARAVLKLTQALLEHPVLEIRYVSAELLSQLDLSTAKTALIPLLDDADLRVALLAWRSVSGYGYDAYNKPADLFERFERLLERTPKDKALAPLVWDWTKRSAEREAIARSLLNELGERPISRLMPYTQLLSGWGRRQVIDLIDKTLKKKKALPNDMYDALLDFVGDKSSDARERAFQVLAKLEPDPEAVKRLEPLLSRKAGDLRRGIITLMLRQPDEAALASAERLVSASKVAIREAGLELLRELKRAQRAPVQVEQFAQAYASRASHNANESSLLADLLVAESETVSLEDGLGLFDPAERSKPIAPQNKSKGLFKRGRVFKTESAPQLISALDELVHTHRETPVRVKNYSGEQEELLGNVRSGIWNPWNRVLRGGEYIYSSATAPIALQAVWEQWWAARPKALRDKDGLEALRAYAAYLASHKHLGKGGLGEASSKLFPKLERSKLRYEYTVVDIIRWFALRNISADTLDFALDAAETSLTLVPEDAFQVWEAYQKEQEGKERWYRRTDLRSSRLFSWFDVLKMCNVENSNWTSAHTLRHWQLLKTLDEGLHPSRRYPPDWGDTLRAYQRGAANDHDVLEYLIGERVNESDRRYVSRSSFSELRRLSAHKRPEVLTTTPQLAVLLDKVRERVLEVELKRADLPTPASLPALALRAVYGAKYVFAILKSLGKGKLLRGYSYDSLSKTAVFSGLLRSSFPSDSDTLESFKAEAQASGVSEQRLLDLAVYAPQWAGFVCFALGWDGLEEAVYWLHAHTKDAGWTVDQHVRDVWNAEVAERTPLSPQDLLDGAVDVAWFARVYNALGSGRWAVLDKAAKYASSGGGGHKRAQLFADALLGNLSFEVLEQRISAKRHQDSVRALGLLPLPASETKKKAAVLRRYALIQDFLRASRKFGSMRQASEKLAATIALENLARSADYADPQRLMWAMEAEEISDLARGPVSVSVDEVTVTLSLDAHGVPDLSIIKKNRALKNVPAKLKKHPEISELLSRKTQLAKQTSRMRSSLEEAMNRGDSFSAADFAELFKHPVLGPMLESLVFITEDGALGYPLDAGKCLRGTDASIVTLGKTSVRLAHPADLLASNKWRDYQKEVFASERKQPFKQIFRELYVLTQAELDAAKRSSRYEGHQVNPRQALALLGKRGWIAVPEEGVRRTFHAEGISVWLEFDEGFYTPAEVDGLTLADVVFSKRGEWQPLALKDVPERVFSEAMRDLDLVVSVAHRGGVDPEASASTVDMRSALLRETLNLLKLDNVRLERTHALIAGDLGDYSIHLGSALVHRQPGGALCIIPVHSQHRGRLFLPFADDDPKTAEVVSKVLLLAKDKEIQDPTILEQLR